MELTAATPGTRVILAEDAQDEDRTLEGSIRMERMHDAKAPDEGMVLVDWNTGLRAWEYAEDLAVLP